MKLLYNAHVYTLDSRLPQAEALVVEGEHIAAVGTSQALLDEFGGRCQRVDLEGMVVIPGLTDAHLHLDHYAQSLQKIDCETATRAECLRRVGERSQKTPPGEWVLGHGWNQNIWPEGFGSAVDLDVVSLDHPVYLTAKSLHAAWANSAALRLAGITADTADPQDGRLGRDSSGKPNGILFESAMSMVARVVPEASESQVVQAIDQAQAALWGMGLTSVHDFDRRRCFVALQDLRQRGRLHLRVLKSIPLELLPQAAEVGLRSGFGDDWLRIGPVKAFADGALGPQTAAMIQPYEGGAADNYGMLFLDGESLYEVGRQAVENGLPLAVHAIGDRANHEVLEAYQRLRDYEAILSHGGTRLRHRIEHLQVIHPDDAVRLAQLEVIASMQPVHATSDMEMADRFWGKRAALSYAWRTQAQHGAVLAFGSDAPVESPNPFWGLHAALTRRRQDGTPGPQGWYPEQRLDMQQALAAYTLGPAYAAGMEDRLGKLAPGYLADLLTLKRDPFACPPEMLFELRPFSTMVGGEWVYGALK